HLWQNIRRHVGARVGALRRLAVRRSNDVARTETGAVEIVKLCDRVAGWQRRVGAPGFVAAAELFAAYENVRFLDGPRNPVGDGAGVAVGEQAIFVDDQLIVALAAVSCIARQAEQNVLRGTLSKVRIDAACDEVRGDARFGDRAIDGPRTDT